MRARRKPPIRVRAPPTLSLGIVLFGAFAVLAAAAALVRDYARHHAKPRPTEDAGAEIPAPELELEGTTKP